jgi:hypothetical protein
MLRYWTPVLLAGLLLLLQSAAGNAQWRPPYRGGGDTGLAGNYINTSNGGSCSISPEGRGYVFINENGSAARFVFVGPRRLEMVSGEWNPGVVATLGRDREGRMLIRFQEPGNKPGYWVAAD